MAIIYISQTLKKKQHMVYNLRDNFCCCYVNTVPHQTFLEFILQHKFSLLDEKDIHLVKRFRFEVSPG